MQSLPVLHATGLLNRDGVVSAVAKWGTNTNITFSHKTTDGGAPYPVLELHLYDEDAFHLVDPFTNMVFCWLHSHYVYLIKLSEGECMPPNSEHPHAMEMLRYNAAAYQSGVLHSPTTVFNSRAVTQVPPGTPFDVTQVTMLSFDPQFTESQVLDASAKNWTKHVFLQGAGMVFESERIEAKIHVHSFVHQQVILRASVHHFMGTIANYAATKYPGDIQIKLVFVLPQGSRLDIQSLIHPTAREFIEAYQRNPDDITQLSLWQKPGTPALEKSYTCPKGTFHAPATRLRIEVEYDSAA